MNIAPLRVGVIGTGIVADLHIEAASHVPQLEIAAVCDVRLDRAKQVAAGLNAAVFGDHRDMLSKAELDAVIITTPHHLHATMAMDAARAGVAVLVEKPIATTVEAATAMIETCRAAGVVLAVGHVLHYGASTRAAAEAVASGALGDVLAITHRRASHYAPGSRPEWFFDPRMAGGGIAMNVGSHGIDRIQWLGGGRVAEVSAQVWNRGGLAIETDAVATMHLDSGVTANLVLTSASVPYQDDTIVLCEGGSIRCGLDGVWISDGGPERLLAPFEDSQIAAFAAQLTDFAAAVRGQHSTLVNGDYGRSVIAAVLAMYQSSATGLPVRVPVDEAAAS